MMAGVVITSALVLSIISPSATCLPEPGACPRH
jgi:hypothetical protein